MSLESRSKRAGLAQGFFGQLNRNISEEKKHKRKMEDSLLALKNNMTLHRSKSQYDAEMEKQKKRRRMQSTIGAVNGRDASGMFNDRGYLAIAAATAPGWDKMNDVQRGKYVQSLSKSMQGTSADKWLNTNFGKLVDTDAVHQATRLPDVYNKQTKGNVVKATNDLVLKDSFAVPEPFAPPVAAPIVTGPSVAGDAVSTGFDPAVFGLTAESPELDSLTVTADDGSKKEVFFAKDDPSKILHEVALGKEIEDPELQSGNFVHLRNKDGDILTDETFAFAVRDGTPSIFKDGKWITAPSNIVLARKEEGRGRAAKKGDDLFLLSDVELRSVSALRTAEDSLQVFADLGQLQDEGLVKKSLVVYNHFREALTANRIGTGDPTTTLTEMMSQMDAAILDENLQVDRLTSEEKISLMDVASLTPDAAQEASFTTGQLRAMRKMLPIMLAKATTDSTRLPIQQVQMFADIITPRIGMELAGSVATLGSLLNARRRGIYRSRYTQDRTPSYLTADSWEFRGGDLRKGKQGLQYGLFNTRDNYTTWRYVGTKPNVADLNRELEHAKQQAK